MSPKDNAIILVIHKIRSFQVYNNVPYGVHAKHEEIAVPTYMQRLPDARYRCMVPECSYVDRKKYNVRVHVVSHLGLKPFKCMYCFYMTCQKCTLISHFRVQHQFENTSKQNLDM